MSYIMEGLYLGSIDDACKKDNLKAKGISHMLTIESRPLSRSFIDSFCYKYVHALDQESSDLISEFEDCIKFIEEGKNCGGIIVHCYYGQSRSATVVLAYVMWKLDLSLDDAQTLVMKQRPQIRPNNGFLKQLELFESMGNCIDKSNEDYRKYKLASIAAKIQQGHVLQALPQTAVSPDPCQNAAGDASHSLYKCQKCRRTLFRSDALLSHCVGVGSRAFLKHAQLEAVGGAESDDICTQSVFIGPVEWMKEEILALNGKLCCPKCHAKLGSFTWAGERCPCGTWVTPAFHIQTSKVDHCKLQQIIQNVKGQDKSSHNTDCKQPAEELSNPVKYETSVSETAACCSTEDIRQQTNKLSLEK